MITSASEDMVRSRKDLTETAVVLGGFVLILLLPGVASSEVYRYEDKDGVVHFTNIPGDDSRYRKVGPDGKIEKKKQQDTKRSEELPSPRVETRYDHLIREAAKRFNLPEALIRAVMAVESNFNPKAISHAGAQGLMQLMPQTAREMDVDNPFDPRQNILGGTRYLRILANSFDGDLVLTLAAYNAGQRAVNRFMDIPPYSETQRYVRRVLRLYYYYKKLSRQEPIADTGRKSR